MFILGITGGIGSGKSTVARYLQNHGITVLDADCISHEVTAAGGRALPDIVALLGDEVLNETGALNRSLVASLIFQKHTLLDRYSYLVHRHIFAEIEARFTKLAAAKCQACVLDVPIPVKDGFLDRCDFIVTVQAPYDLRIERLIQRGMSVADAQRRIKAQLTPEAYREIAHLVVDNDTDLKTLQKKVETEIFPLFEARGIRLLPVKNLEE